MRFASPARPQGNADRYAGSAEEQNCVPGAMLARASRAPMKISVRKPARGRRLARVLFSSSPTSLAHRRTSTTNRSPIAVCQRRSSAAALAVGEDPLAHERLHALYAATRQVSGGIAAGVAAIKMPCSTSKRGTRNTRLCAVRRTVRERLRLYSRIAAITADRSTLIGKPSLRSLEDAAAAGRGPARFQH
jgi:hypothetical protein